MHKTGTERSVGLSTLHASSFDLVLAYEFGTDESRPVPGEKEGMGSWSLHDFWFAVERKGD
jgi:hypothetical protein